MEEGSRRRSPMEMCTMPWRSVARRVQSVPLPTPGAPIINVSQKEGIGTDEGDRENTENADDFSGVAVDGGVLPGKLPS